MTISYNFEELLELSKFKERKDKMTQGVYSESEFKELGFNTSAVPVGVVGCPITVSCSGDGDRAGVGITGL